MTAQRVLLGICLCVGVAQAQLRIDFSRTNGPVQEGFQAYVADHEAAATFTAQTFDAFGTSVTITPAWAAGATPQAMQMIDRGGDDGMDRPDLMRDWIGTDTRQPGNPMTLTLSGLPGGTYAWRSYHGDPQDQTGIFTVTFTDATGDNTVADVDISDGRDSGQKTAEQITVVEATIASDGVNPVTIVFDLTSPTSPVNQAFFVMNGFELESLIVPNATRPSPANAAVEVPRDGTVLTWAAGEAAVRHDLYLGTDADRVAAATTTDPEFQGSLTEPSLALDRLTLEQTYYWRVDEVTDDGTVTVGSVWQFSVEPVAYAVAPEAIQGRASSGGDPNVTFLGIGLGAAGTHDIDTATMWLSDGEPNAWIEYTFDAVRKLDRVRVWNHNTQTESVLGFGMHELVISYTADGVTWSALPAMELPQAAGTTQEGGTSLSLDGIVAQTVRLTARSNWSLIGLTRTGLSEVRFFAEPVTARNLAPADGAADVDPVDARLSWRAGREADTHRLLLDTDVTAVTDGTAPAVDLAAPSYRPDLQLDTTYAWRVDEVNEAGSLPVWPGTVQSFTTAASVVVDDMESYRSEDGGWIWETWSDGFEDAANGALLGHNGGNDMETTRAIQGSQSLPFYYGQGGATTSLAVRTPPMADWRAYGIHSLRLRFQGDPTNTASSLYVTINGQRVPYDGDAADIQRRTWHAWTIDLDAVTGANLGAVTEFGLGLDGGDGLVLFDDIRLSPQPRERITPEMPADTGRVAQFALDGGLTDTTGAWTLTAEGAPLFGEGVNGQAVRLDGVGDYLVWEGPFDLPTYTAALWFRVDGGLGSRDLLSAIDAAGGHGILLEVNGQGAVRYLHRFPFGTGGGTNLYSGPGYDDGTWQHVAIVKDAETITLYLNGVAVAATAETTAFTALQTISLGVLMPSNLVRYFPGALDDVALYARPLSPAEVAGLAGRSVPLDLP